MTWPTAFIIVGGLFALALTVIKVVTTIWGGDIKKACKSKFQEIERQVADVNDTGEIRRNTCMDIFTQLKNQVQTLLLQNAVFEGNIKNLAEKILEIKEKQDRIDGKIDKLMFLLPKRSGNHINE